MFFLFSWIRGLFEWTPFDSNPFDCFLRGQFTVSIDSFIFFDAADSLFVFRACECLWRVSSVQSVESIQFHSNMQVKVIERDRLNS